MGTQSGGGHGRPRGTRRDGTAVDAHRACARSASAVGNPVAEGRLRRRLVTAPTLLRPRGGRMSVITPIPDTASEQAVFRKVVLRIVPFLMLCYVISYLDRVNVGFAKLQMSSDLGFSEAAFGLGAGLFFIGYFFFEVPSNMILQKVGAKVWIARIMITWGIVSGSFMFVNNEIVFYILRFLLGVAEAGFYPGVIFYCTLWFPAHRRARVIAMFMSAIPLAGIFGNPLSGWIMGTFDE